MALISIDQMYVGETAEIVSIDGKIPEIKKLRDMGIREGKLIDLLHSDSLATKKIVIGFDNTRLAFDIKIACNIKVRPLKSYYETVKALSQYDNLTKCFNRHEANRILKDEYEKFTTKGIPFSLIIADIDYFKKINDKYGHSAGDEILKTFAELLRKNMKRSDIICRWGGEEFMILLRGTPVDSAVHVAERARRIVEAHAFPPFAGSGNVTISVGCCGVPPDKPIQILIDLADSALYAAKNNGRNQVKICNE
ncbi:MAG: diguanylate cyclase [Candidatus Kuenenia sp.]|nr:diguanylate cyclase [Candidatus Kuenenia hertensis]